MPAIGTDGFIIFCSQPLQYSSRINIHSIIIRYNPMIHKILNRSLLRNMFSTKKLQTFGKYSEKYTKARTMLQLFNLVPIITGDVFIAPNATIAGQVFIGNNVSVWHGTVIRGDINAVMIHTNVFIGNNCVLHTAASNSSGLPAHLEIQDDVVVQHGSTLYSCILKERAYIGHNSVVLQGAIVEYGAIVLPNSVVPPGRVVPSMQVWGGNPIKFVRHVKEQEAWVTLEEAREQMRNTYDYREQFLPYNNAYLYKPNEASVIIDQGKDLEFERISGADMTERAGKAEKYDPLNSTLN